jgi:hypothetical protein
MMAAVLTGVPMQPLLVFLVLAAIAVVLFRPARRLAQRTLTAPARPDTRYAAMVNMVVLAAIFAWIILAELGWAGIPAMLAGIVLGAEGGVMISYMLAKFIFGEA